MWSEDRQPAGSVTVKVVSAALFVVSLLSIFSVNACRTRYRGPELGGIYNRSASHHSIDRNPVIVIPGVLGSKLVDRESGRMVWGAFGGDAVKPGEPGGSRLIALPMAEGAALDNLWDEVEADGVLDQVSVNLFGLPLHLKAYFHILNLLGSGGYRDEGLGSSGGLDYGDDHFTCFQFDYDWRRDNVESARLLHQFIEEKGCYVREQLRIHFGPGDYSDLKFDIVAHSMGCLVARYYLRYGTADVTGEAGLVEPTWAGCDMVERLIMVGPPNAGSLESLVNLVQGRRFSPFTPRYHALLLGTFPSTYQLLPRTRHGAVVSGTAGEDERLDLFDPELWVRMKWGLANPAADHLLQDLLPGEADAGVRRRIALEHQGKCLLRAERFQAALDRPASPPAGVDLFLIAGDAIPTARQVAVDTSGKLEMVSVEPGDGSVLRGSALMDERMGGPWSPMLVSPVHWEDVLFLFTDHLQMTKDPAFADNVLYRLLEDPRGVR